MHTALARHIRQFNTNPLTSHRDAAGREDLQRCLRPLQLVRDTRMQFRLVAGVLLVLFAEINDLDGPRHAASAQHVDHAKVIEAHVEAELLQTPGVPTRGYFGLEMGMRGSNY